MSKLRGATTIVGIDLKTEKFTVATKMGMTKGLDGTQKNLKEALMEMQPWGYDYTFGIILLNHIRLHWQHICHENGSRSSSQRLGTVLCHRSSGIRSRDVSKAIQSCDWSSVERYCIRRMEVT